MKPKWLEAEEEFESFFPSKSQFLFKFHDTRAAMGVTGTRNVKTTEHPSDYILTDNGVMLYAEVKSSENKTSLSFSNIQKGQWSAAIRQVAAGGLYIFFIYSFHLKMWYKVPARVLIEQQQIRQSIKWSELSDYEWRV